MLHFYYKTPLLVATSILFLSSATHGADDADAEKAIQELDGSEIEGRKIGVSVARPREENRNRINYNRR